MVSGYGLMAAVTSLPTLQRAEGVALLLFLHSEPRSLATRGGAETSQSRELYRELNEAGARQAGTSRGETGRALSETCSRPGLGYWPAVMERALGRMEAELYCRPAVGAYRAASEPRQSRGGAKAASWRGGGSLDGCGFMAAAQDQCRGLGGSGLVVIV